MKNLIVSMGLISLLTISCSSQSLPKPTGSSVKTDNGSENAFGSETGGSDTGNIDISGSDNTGPTYGGSNGGGSNGGGFSDGGNNGFIGDDNQQCGSIPDAILQAIPNRVKDEMSGSMEVRCAIESADATRIRSSIMSLPTCRQNSSICDSQITQILRGFGL